MIKVTIIVLLVFAALSFLAGIAGALALIAAPEIRHQGTGMIAYTSVQILISVAIVTSCVSLLQGMVKVIKGSVFVLPFLALTTFAIAVFYMWGEIKVEFLLPHLILQSFPALLLAFICHVQLQKLKMKEANVETQS